MTTADRDTLILTHQSLVRRVASSIAQRLPRGRVELEDLVGAGNLGLVLAAEAYDESKGVKFKAFASFRVRGAILDSLRVGDMAPRAARKQAREVKAAYAELRKNLGRAPEIEELAAHTGLSLGELHELHATIHNTVVTSLNAPASDDPDMPVELIDNLASLPDHDPLVSLLGRELEQIAFDAVETLPEREAAVVRSMYFGDMAQQDIAAARGVSPGRISQIHCSAIKLLQATVAALMLPSMEAPCAA